MLELLRQLFGTPEATEDEMKQNWPHFLRLRATAQWHSVMCTVS